MDGKYAYMPKGDERRSLQNNEYVVQERVKEIN